MKSTLERQSYFINVDLDIYSRSNLERLVSGFGERVFVLHSGREGRRYAAHLELAGVTPAGPDIVITRLVRLVNQLPTQPRELWNGASSRTFNIGVQAGLQPLSIELLIKPATVAAILSVSAGIVLTVYSPAIKAARVGGRERA